MNAFLTGINGFAGRHLADLLLAEGWKVAGLVHPSDIGRTADLEARYLPLFSGALDDKEALARAVKAVEPDLVVHLAAITHVHDSWERVEETLQVNLLGTLHLLEALRPFKERCRIVAVSSAEVYGVVPEADQPIKESFPLNPATPYAVSKASMELLCGQYVRGMGYDIVVSRSFNHTGPGQSPTFVCPNFARQVARIKKGLAPPLLEVGNLDARRDFSDVRDTVAAYLALAQKGERGKVYNVCSGEAPTIRSLVEFLIAEAGIPIEVVVDQKRYRPVDVPLTLGSHEALTADTGWEPCVPLEQTLRDLLVYWEESKL